MSRVTLKMVGNACPEMYDAYIDGQYIGYMRLRNGCFRAEYSIEDKTVYKAFPKGDGCFASDGERRRHLNAACKALLAHHLELDEPIYEIENALGL